MGGICTHVCASELVHTEAKEGAWVFCSVIVICSTLTYVSPECAEPYQPFVVAGI